MLNFFKGLRQGTLRVPDFMNTINPPSLFAYYETLPKWARDHPAVRNVLMAFEYHKPTLDIRQKEIAMNYAMSYIRPIDPVMEDIIIEVATSTKLRMNIARGKEMLNQLKFYEIEETELGTDTESEEEIGEGEGAPGQISQGVDEEEEELMRQRSAMERFASGLDEDSREREAAQIMEQELNITQYQVEPEMEKVMTDFYLKPYPDPKEPTPEPLIQPINFYDNDDGFWTEYISHKQNKWAANPLIVNRPFLKH